MPLSSAIFSFFPSYTIFFTPRNAISSFFPAVNFFCTLDALSINPQKKRSSRLSRSSRGKILKRKVAQEPPEERSSRSSRGKFLKSLKRKDPQEERSSRGKILQILKILKILRIIRRKDPHENSQGQFRCTAVRVYVADFSPNLLKLDMY